MLELVVALVVTGAVAAAGAAAFRQTIDRRTQLLASATSTERAAAVRALVREWLSTGTLVWPTAGEGVAFTTTAPTPAGIAGVPMRLFIDDDPATPTRGLTLAYETSPSNGAELREIDAEITSMRVEYLEPRTGRWVLGDADMAERPRALRITFPPQAPEAANTMPATDRLQHLPITIVYWPSPNAANEQLGERAP